MSLEERLARLERENRHLRWVLAVCVCAGVLAGASGWEVVEDGRWETVPVREGEQPVVMPQGRAAAAPTVVQAGRFELVDASGRVVAAMALTREGGGVVYTNNADGTLVAQMGAADDGRGVLWTYDRAGMLRDDSR